MPAIVSSNDPSVLATPDAISDQITCPLTALPSPPGSAQMSVKPDADQPSPMCPGKKAVYECSTSGINVRLVSPPQKI